MNFTRTLKRLKAKSQAAWNSWEIRKNSKMLKVAASVSILGAVAIAGLLFYKKVRENLNAFTAKTSVINEDQPKSFVKMAIITAKKALLAVIGSVVVGAATVVSMPVLGGLLAVNAVISLAKYVGGMFATNTANNIDSGYDADDDSSEIYESNKNVVNKPNRRPIVWSEQKIRTYHSLDLIDAHKKVVNNRRRTLSA